METDYGNPNTISRSRANRIPSKERAQELKRCMNDPTLIEGAKDVLLKQLAEGFAAPSGGLYWTVLLINAADIWEVDKLKLLAANMFAYSEQQREELFYGLQSRKTKEELKSWHKQTALTFFAKPRFSKLDNLKQYIFEFVNSIECISGSGAHPYFCSRFFFEFEKDNGPIFKRSFGLEVRRHYTSLHECAAAIINCDDNSLTIENLPARPKLMAKYFQLYVNKLVELDAKIISVAPFVRDALDSEGYVAHVAKTTAWTEEEFSWLSTKPAPFLFIENKLNQIVERSEFAKENKLTAYEFRRLIRKNKQLWITFCNSSVVNSTAKAYYATRLDWEQLFHDLQSFITDDGDAKFKPQNDGKDRYRANTKQSFESSHRLR